MAATKKGYFESDTGLLFQKIMVAVASGAADINTTKGYGNRDQWESNGKATRPFEPS